MRIYPPHSEEPIEIHDAKMLDAYQKWLEQQTREPVRIRIETDPESRIQFPDFTS